MRPRIGSLGLALGMAAGLALAWAGPQAGSAAAAVMRAAADGTGTMQVWPTSVTANRPTKLTFTYTATTLLNGGTITLVVPAGWTPPSLTPGPGYTTVSCATATVAARDCQLAVSAATGTITITNLYLNVDLGTTLDITYDMASAPASATTSTFAAAEQSFPQGTLTGLPSSPTVAVSCPDGSGTMTVSPSAVTAASARTLTFTYTAGSCGTGPGGVVTLRVPDGWTPPATTSGAAGYATWTGAPLSAVAPMTIVVPVGPLRPGETVSVKYELAMAPDSPATYPFDAAERSRRGGILASLTAGSPTVRVTPSGAGSSSPSNTTGQSSTPPPPPPQDPAGSMTVTPHQVLAGRPSTLTFTYRAPRAGLPPSGEITVNVPAGWTAPSASPGQLGYARSEEGVLSVAGQQIIVTGFTLAGGGDLTITYTGLAAPSAAGQSTFVTSARSDRTARLTVLPVSPAVTVALAGAAGGPPRWLAIVLVIGLAAAVSAAGALVRRRVRRPGWTPAGPSVRAMPHPGAPASVIVHDTGLRPTLTVRIEPHASAAVTAIRGDRR